MVGGRIIIMNFFYVVSNGKNCKIGITGNTVNRLNSLQTGSSDKLVIVNKWEFKKRFNKIF